ncbi:CDP-diacylglycerol diphosphatase [Rhizobium leguminosarum]|uniref:CDP-diacylglycerol diphosphatase n=1 Tax=Rhizobium TaxID=379 RepID=UPI0018D5165C|nr:CDP-diacylglycerol diphosphatase [Rhizobium leguminosarum]
MGKIRFLGCLGLLAFVVAAYLYSIADRKALARIIDDSCHLNVRNLLPSPPCERVDVLGGYVILKDRKGSAHFLLLPTINIAGIESPELTADVVPHYFARAWAARGLVADATNGRVSDERLLFAVNSKSGRSQDLLHIHIACMYSDLRQRIDQVERDADSSWTPLPISLKGHSYWMRRVFKIDICRVIDDIDNDLTPMARSVLRDLHDDFRRLEARIRQVSDEIEKIADTEERARRLMAIPGIGPLGATAILP